MDNPLSISRSLALHPIGMAHFHQFVHKLRPLIELVAGEIAKGVHLGHALQKARDRHPALAQNFDMSAGAFGLLDEYLFPDRDQIRLMAMANRRTRQALVIRGQREVSALGEILRLCAKEDLTERELRAQVSDDNVDDLLFFGALDRRVETRLLRARRGPGIIRLQHAGLLFRSRTKGVLVDPHFNSSYEPEGLTTFSVADVRDYVDAIIISHSHEDHWSPASLLFFPRDCPIIVPHVDRLTLVAHDMAAELRALGFTNVQTPNWYGAPICVGDIEIHALPFFGEQPLRSQFGRNRDLRNWGNTYVIRTPEYSAWILIDAGDDEAGTMAEVAAHVARCCRPLDFLLSNLRPFLVGSGIGSPWYITGSGHYWLALTPSQVQTLPNNHDQITLGPEGVAEIARLTGAKYFLPYAHWWAPLGTRPEGELEHLRLLQQSLGDAPTEIWEWAIGDGYFLENKGKARRIQCW